MRILITTDAFPPTAGGSGWSTYELARGLRARGHDIFIVRTYSDHILFPIELVPEEGEPRQIISASALWQRSKSDLTADDYKKAYQQIASAFDDRRDASGHRLGGAAAPRGPRKGLSRGHRQAHGHRPQ